jgi:DNA-binding transcriptional MerR regulator/effector-binding domain-containing protein
MFSIGEFARLGGVSVRTLRHYDEIGLLRPVRVDAETGYRHYSADQLGRLNRIIAMKELGLTLTQVRQLLAGISLDELQGMLLLRRAQLEQEIEANQNQLLGIEARLGYIERETAMPADDITMKNIQAMGVVVIAAPAPGWGPVNIVPVVNRARELFDELAISAHARATGPFMIFYEHDQGNDITVNLALPVAEQPAKLPAPVSYRVLPEVEAAVAVRTGPAAGIFPMVYQDLARWAEAHGYATTPPGREVWVNEIDDASQSAQQVFEIQLPFTRPGPT